MTFWQKFSPFLCNCNFCGIAHFYPKKQEFLSWTIDFCKISAFWHKDTTLCPKVVILNNFFKIVNLTKKKTDFYFYEKKNLISENHGFWQNTQTFCKFVTCEELNVFVLFFLYHLSLCEIMNLTKLQHFGVRLLFLMVIWAPTRVCLCTHLQIIVIQNSIDSNWVQNSKIA